jgi:hypothetical protein
MICSTIQKNYKGRFFLKAMTMSRRDFSLNKKPFFARGHSYMLFMSMMLREGGYKFGTDRRGYDNNDNKRKLSRKNNKENTDSY